MRKRFAAVLVLLLPLAAVAQTGELWEITMQIPGMPAGMMPPQRVCQGDDPARAAQQDPNKRDCKVTDRKQSAGRITITMSCADGSTNVIDQQYNAARTEFKSTMTSKGSREGDMTMNMTGRKVGACDAVAERKARDAQVDSAKKQAAAGMAASAAALKQQSDQQIKQCHAAVESMQFSALGAHGQCYKKAAADRQCDGLSKAYPEAAKACSARTAEFCKRFQTQEGFLKAKADESAAQMCGVSTASIKGAQCPKAAQSGSLAFLGAYCPVEAKPIAMEHCAGRDYTSKMGGKYSQFCQNYLANADFERPPAAKPAAAPAQKGGATDQVKQGVSKGLDAIKGLFGR